MPKTNHPRISQTEWGVHKETIRKMYLSEDKSLMGEGGVIDLMKRKGFSASKPQYESQFMRWGFKKKLTRETWHTLGRIIKDRDEAGLISHVYANGLSLSDEKVKKEIARYRICEASGECCLKKELPTGVEIRSDQEADQEGAEETILRLEAQGTYLNDLQMISPPTNLHVPEEPWNLASDYNYPMNNPNDIYNRVVTDHPTPISYRDTSPYFSHSDTLSLAASTQQSPSNLVLGIREIQDIFYIPRSTISLFADVNKPIFREFRALFKNNQSNVLASINQTKYLLPREPARELVKDSVDKVILKQILYLLMNNFAGFDYAVFDSIFEQVRQFSVPHMEDMLDALPHPYAAALQQSILTIAIKSNIPALVRVLLRRGLDVNRVSCRFGGTQYAPLSLACKFRHLELVKILLRACADPNGAENLNATITPIAALVSPALNPHRKILQSVDADILRDLLDAGCRAHWIMLQNLGFWKNEAMLDVYLYHNKLPIMWSPCSCGFYIDAMSEAMKLYPAKKVTAVFQSALQNLAFSEIPVILKNALQVIFGIASYQGNLSLVTYLLEFGLTPSLDCLSQAVYGNNLTLINMYVQMGMEISQSFEPKFKRKHILRRVSPTLNPDLLEGYFVHHKNTTILAEAIRHGNQEIVSLFKDQGIAQAAKDPNQANIAILAAVEAGHEAMIRELLPIYQEVKNVSNQDKDLMNAATLEGNDKIIELLMVAGVSFDSTSIAAAILKRNPRLVRLFLDSAVPLMGTSYLVYLAVRRGDHDVLKLLINAGVVVDGEATVAFPLHLQSLGARHGESKTPLTEAIRQGDHGAIELLLEKGAYVNGSPLANYNSPLAQAVNCGHEQLVQALLDRGADPNDPYVLQVAANKSYELTRAILASFVQRYPNGNKTFAIPALREAIRQRNERMVSMLASHTDLNCTMDTERDAYMHLPSLLGEGIATGSIKIVQILLRSGGNPDSTVELGTRRVWVGRRNAILKSISIGKLAMVELLHSAGANLNFSATLCLTRTALQLAVELGNFEIVKFLLDHGVDVNAAPCIRNGGTALQYAASAGSIRIAELLLDHGANIDAPGSKYLGRTAFEFAAEHGRMDMLLLLFHRGVDLVSDGGEKIRRAGELAEKNGQIAAKDLVEQLGAEAQWRAISSSETNLSQGLMTDTSVSIGLLLNKSPYKHRGDVQGEIAW